MILIAKIRKVIIVGKSQMWVQALTLAPNGICVICCRQAFVSCQVVQRFVEDVQAVSNVTDTAITIAGPAESDRRAACRFLPGLTQKQRLWCLDNYIFLEPIALGAQIAQDQCRKQFANRRWNCPTNRPAVYSKIYDRGTCCG